MYIARMAIRLSQVGRGAKMDHALFRKPMQQHYSILMRIEDALVATLMRNSPRSGFIRFKNNFRASTHRYLDTTRSLSGRNSGRSSLTGTLKRSLSLTVGSPGILPEPSTVGLPKNVHTGRLRLPNTNEVGQSLTQTSPQSQVRQPEIPGFSIPLRSSTISRS